MRKALEDLLGDLGPTTQKHAYKKSFPMGKGPITQHKVTIPDNAAAQAQLKKQIALLEKTKLADAVDDDDFDDEDFDD